MRRLVNFGAKNLRVREPRASLLPKSNATQFLRPRRRTFIIFLTTHLSFFLAPDLDVRRLKTRFTPLFWLLLPSHGGRARGHHRVALLHRVQERRAVEVVQRAQALVELVRRCTLLLPALFLPVSTTVAARVEDAAAHLQRHLDRLERLLELARREEAAGEGRGPGRLGGEVGRYGRRRGGGGGGHPVLAGRLRFRARGRSRLDAGGDRGRGLGGLGGGGVGGVALRHGSPSLLSVSVSSASPRFDGRCLTD